MTDTQEKQIDLFGDEQPRHDGLNLGYGLRQNYRKTDPVTSQLAGQDIVESGACGRQQAFWLDLVQKYPGRTSRELAFMAQVDRYQGSRRLPELERDKKVKRGADKVCTQGGKLSATWWPA